MKIKDLYNPTISGTTYVGFLQAMQSISPINSNWITSVSLPVLDNYIKLKMYNRNVYDIFDEISTDTYNLLAVIFKANEYKLDGLYRSTTFDSQYSPIENYDRYEDTTVSQDINNGAQQGQTQNSYTEYTDTDTSSNTNSILSVDDYGNKTEKNVTDMKHAAHTDTSTTTANAVHNDIDTTTDSHIHGNIGVMRVDQMLDGDRQIHNYVFFDAICNILYENVLSTITWE